jgi:hypothetical protein
VSGAGGADGASNRRYIGRGIAADVHEEATARASEGDIDRWLGRPLDIAVARVVDDANDVCRIGSARDRCR